MGGFAAQVWQRDVSKEDEDNKARFDFQIAPLRQAIGADQQRLSTMKEGTPEYDQTLNNIALNVGRVRNMLGDKTPADHPGRLAETINGIRQHLKLGGKTPDHLNSEQAQKVGNWNAQNTTQAQAYATGALPFEMTPEGQKAAYTRQTEMDVARQRGTMREYTSPDGKERNWFRPGDEPEGWNATVGSQSQSGVPRVIGHTSAKDAISLIDSIGQKFESPDGSEITKDQLSKLPPFMELTTVTQGGKTFHIITDQRTHLGTVGNVRYQIPDVGGIVGQANPLGEARTSTSTTDPFGVTTTSTPSSPGMAQSVRSSAPTSPPSAPVPFGRTHDKLVRIASSARSGSHSVQLDAQGHIPENAANPQLVQAANSLLDGMDVNKLPLPEKDRPAAMALAQKYGYKGQGLFTPRESLQLREGATVIHNFLNSKALDVLDHGTISNLPMLGQSIDPSKSGLWSKLATSLASKMASPEQQEFMRYWRQLDALAIGLRGLVQTGRATQTQVDRLIAELPNPYNTTNSADARRRLQMVQNELQVAAQSGKLSDVPTGASGSDQRVRKFNPSTGRLE